MLEKIIFLLGAFLLFVIVFYKIIRKNDTNYISLIVVQALGIIICFFEINMGVTASMFFITLRYFCAIILPIMIIVMEMKGINFSEVLSLIRVNFWLLIGDRKAAKDILIKLVSKYPESYIGHKTLAEIYEKEGGMRKAIDEYVCALDLKKDDYKSYFKIADLLNQLDRKDEAIEMLQNLVKAKPDSYDGMMLLGELLCEQERFKEAANVYQDGLKYFSSDFELYYSLGIVFTRLNEFTLAKEMYEKAAELNHLLYGAYYNMGQICFIERDLEAAEKYFVKCLRDKELDASAYYQLAKIYAIRGDKEKAIEYINIAVKINSKLLKKAAQEKVFEEIREFITVSVNMEEEQKEEEEEEKELTTKEKSEKIAQKYLEETYNLVELMSENTARQRAEEKVTNIINKEKLRKMLEAEELEEALGEKKQNDDDE